MLKIKEILKEKGMSVSDLSDRLGVTRQTLHRQMQGKLLVETAQRIADALDVPLWKLFAPNNVEEINSQEHVFTCECGRRYRIEEIK